MSRRSVRARSSQIYINLVPFVDNVGDDLGVGSRTYGGKTLPLAPPEHWKTLLQSYHERIDTSYWLSIGRGDVYADAMVQLQKSLEYWTRQLVEKAKMFITSDGVTKTLTQPVKLFPQDDEGFELPIFLRYDPKLLSRWKALFHAMAGSDRWTRFELKNIELPTIVMGELSSALDDRLDFFPEDEYSLYFHNNNLGAGVLKLGILKELYITRNAIGHLPTISTSSCLRKLNLSGSYTGNGSICLSTLSCTNLHELLLNNMPSGVTITNDCLGYNPPLQLLEMKSNHLGDNDAKILAASLRSNTNLKTLSLHGNNFSEVSESAFTKAICNNEDLNAVIDSNHTCTVCGVTEEIEGLQCTKEEKKFHSLKPNGVSFVDVPLELMHLVLAWVLSVPRHGFPSATSLILDALRTYWDLPSLFMGRHQPEEVKMCLRDMISTISNEEMVCGQSFHQASLPPRKHGEYDIVLPRTNQGFLLNVGENTLLTLSNRELALLNIGETGNELTRTLFLGYRRFPDGSKGLPEIFTLVKQYGDVITAVNGISIVGKSFKEGIPLLKVNLPFLHMRLQSRRSILRPFHESAYSEYIKSYDLSVKLKHQVTEMQNKYDGLIMSQNEEVQEGCDKSERLKRLHAREQAGIKNDLQHARDTFAAAERNRGKAWSLLIKIRAKIRDY